MLGLFAAIWGFSGMCMLFGSAIYRLSPMAMSLSPSHFHWYHWAALVACLIFMGFGEGYRGFQQNFSPRAAARVRYLSRNPTLVRLIFAPLFCMGYFHATRRRKIVSYCITSGIIVLILIVHQITQPWRGIIDAGVLLGLAWGILSLAAFTLKAFTNPNFNHSPETP